MSRFLKTMILPLLAVAAFAITAPTPAIAFDNSGQATMTTGQLPREGRETLALIRKGGPYPYAKDGTIFSNRERALPREPRGFYHEYTVKTPGSRDRGARRIICGGAQQTCYYTADHYATFKLIKE